jgi:hypothetical protein
MLNLPADKLKYKRPNEQRFRAQGYLKGANERP